MKADQRFGHTGRMPRGLFQACALVAASAACLAAADAAPAPRIMRANPHVASINPHLHGVKMISPHAALHKPQAALHNAKEDHGDAAREHATGHDRGLGFDRTPFRHRLWANGWDAASWQAEHLRYGSVRGVVVNAQGAPLRNARVWLRKPGGQTFAKHWRVHAVMTDGAGRFAMTHVIAQPYRLCVRPNPKGALQHVQIDVKPSVVLPERFEFH